MAEVRLPIFQTLKDELRTRVPDGHAPELLRLIVSPILAAALDNNWYHVGYRVPVTSTPEDADLQARIHRAPVVIYTNLLVDRILFALRHGASLDDVRMALTRHAHAPPDRELRLNGHQELYLHVSVEDLLFG